MKQCVILFIFTFFLTGFFYNPVFVDAKSTCWVDEDNDDGDGDEDDPYEDIEEALKDDCDKIIVEKGTYDDDITVNRSTTIEGKNRDDVIISGKVTMKNGSEIKDLTVSGKGVEVEEDADAEIDNVKIINASIGISTSGRGDLTVKDSVIKSNGKGMYLQKGKNVDITDTEVYDNDEEGIDIRANVDGRISNNSIYDNGESGIEVILGKSELTISNNSIKDNKASGIAMQYYKESSKLGAVKVKGNSIKSNKDYGVNCKAPSGGNPGADYWSASTNMSSNKVSGNKDGEFSESCSFSAETVSSATKTKKQLEEERLAKELAEKEKLLAQQKLQAEQEVVDDRQKEEDVRRMEQERLRVKAQQEKDLKEKVDSQYSEYTQVSEINRAAEDKIQERNVFVTFIIGPRYKEMKQIKKTLPFYDQKAAELKKILQESDSQEISADISQKVQRIEKEKEFYDTIISHQEQEFSLFGWIFNRKDKEK